VQRAAVLAGGDLGVGLPGLRERQVAGQGDDGVDLGLEPLEALEVDPGQPLGGQLAGLDPARLLGHRREREVVVPGGQLARRPGAAHEAVAGGPDGEPGQGRVPVAGGRHGRIQRDLARAGPALVQRCHRHPPVAGGLGALGRGVAHLHQLLGLGDRAGGDRRAGRGAGAERRWLPGGRCRRGRRARGLRRVGPRDATDRSRPEQAEDRTLQELSA